MVLGRIYTSLTLKGLTVSAFLKFLVSIL